MQHIVPPTTGSVLGGITSNTEFQLKGLLTTGASSRGDTICRHLCVSLFFLIYLFLFLFCCLFSFHMPYKRSSNKKMSSKFHFFY